MCSKGERQLVAKQIVKKAGSFLTQRGFFKLDAETFERIRKDSQILFWFQILGRGGFGPLEIIPHVHIGYRSISDFLGELPEAAFGFEKDRHVNPYLTWKKMGEFLPKPDMGGWRIFDSTNVDEMVLFIERVVSDYVLPELDLYPDLQTFLNNWGQEWNEDLEKGPQVERIAVANMLSGNVAKAIVLSQKRVDYQELQYEKMRGFRDYSLRLRTAKAFHESLIAEGQKRGLIP